MVSSRQEYTNCRAIFGELTVVPYKKSLVWIEYSYLSDVFGEYYETAR